MERGHSGQTREGAKYKTYRLKDFVDKNIKKDYEKDS